MTGRSQGRTALAAWVVVAAVAGAGLYWAGDGPLAPPPLTEPAAWGGWLAARDPVTAAMAILRLLALIGLWYLVVATALGLTLRVARADGLVALADRLTVAPLRRLLVATVGLSVASGLAPAWAVARAASPPAAVVAVAQPSGPTTSAAFPPAPLAMAASPSTTSAHPAPLPTLTMRLLPPPGEDGGGVPAAPAGGPAPATRPPPAVSQPATATTWTVRPGECFWSIAEDVLTMAWGRPASDAEIVPYWHTLIEQNRARLADRGNPDLIFPGQVFAVPAPPAAGR